MPAPEARDLRAEILLAARPLFIEHGYRGLSMRQIAEEVGVSKAALYYHFQDKEALFVSLLVPYLDEIGALIVRICEQEATAHERVRAFVQAILGQADEQRALIRLGMQEISQLDAARRLAFSQAYRQKFILPVQAILEAGISSGELRPVDPPVAAWTLLGMMYPYFYPAHIQAIPADERVAEQIVTIYLEGITYGSRTAAA